MTTAIRQISSRFQIYAVFFFEVLTTIGSMGIAIQTSLLEFD